MRVDNLVKRFGGLVATNHVSLSLSRGEIHALIGPNGAGKTTFIHQVSGNLKPDDGRILLKGRDVTHSPVAARARRGLGRSFQITSMFGQFTVLDNVSTAVQARQGHSFRFWRDARRDKMLTGPAMECLARVGLADRAEALACHISHGEQRQLELAMVLATQPDVLLLDEPTAGMGSEESQNIVALLGQLQADFGILLVEHDMTTVFALADTITVLVNGSVLASGSPETIRGDRDVRKAYLGEHCEGGGQELTWKEEECPEDS